MIEQHERLRRYNRWRRGDQRLRAPDPKALGELIDGVADRLEVLEREHTELFDRWHGERRKREKLEHDVERCHRMLLSEESVTKGALLKAENILREAIADQKIGADRTATEGRGAAMSGEPKTNPLDGMMNAMDTKRRKRGGRQQVLRTYLKLHEQERLGEHWMWAAIERVAAGEKEDAALADYGYTWARPIAHNS